jgi:hypothetical protein
MVPGMEATQSLVCGFHAERGKACPDTATQGMTGGATGSAASGRDREALRTVAGQAADRLVAARKPRNGGGARGRVARGVVV